MTAVGNIPIQQKKKKRTCLLNNFNYNSEQFVVYGSRIWQPFGEFDFGD